MGCIEKIGNVKLNLDYYNGNDLYCDGEIEDEILKIVSENDKSEFNKIIMQRKNWAVFYHLSELRCNCIEWIEVDKNAYALEIGAGCGAITGCLAEKCSNVDCIELSKKRSTINAQRNKERDNIEIYVGNFEDVYKSLNKKYDLITLIGVFEYADMYIAGNNSYFDMLNIVKCLLKPKGTLVIAIENKLGMKYWAGCREDHTGRLFDSIENYPSNNGIRTFTKKELTDIMLKVGFKNNSFFYPYPDYKFAVSIYSDDFLPQKGELNTNRRNFDNDRVVLFDEKKAFDNIIENNLFPIFSNSYIVIAKEG